MNARQQFINNLSTMSSKILNEPNMEIEVHIPYRQGNAFIGSVSMKNPIKKDAHLIFEFTDIGFGLVTMCAYEVTDILDSQYKCAIPLDNEHLLKKEMINFTEDFYNTFEL